MDIHIFRRNRLVKNLSLFLVFLFNALALASFAIRVDLIAVLALVIISFFLYNMAKEDALFKTVDLRKCFFLLMGLLAATKKTQELYLMSSVFFFATLLFLSIGGGLVAYFCIHTMPPAEVKVIEQKRREIPFLPCFVAGLFAFFIITMIVVYGFGDIDFLARQLEFGAFFDQYILLWEQEISVCTGVLLFFWYLLQKKKIDVEKHSGIGMGDVIFLSVFAPFLGFPTFAFVLFLATIIAFCWAIFKYTGGKERVN